MTYARSVAEETPLPSWCYHNQYACILPECFLVLSIINIFFSKAVSVGIEWNWQESPTGKFHQIFLWEHIYWCCLVCKKNSMEPQKNIVKIWQLGARILNCDVDGYDNKLVSAILRVPPAFKLIFDNRVLSNNTVFSVWRHRFFGGGI